MHRLPDQRRASRAAMAMIALATVAVYVQVRTHGYVNLDDDVYVLENPWVRSGLSWDTVRWAFTTIHEAYWIPLTWLSFAFDCQLFGLDAGPALLENVALHTLDGLLLYAFLARTTGAPGRSVWVAGLFLLHPIHVESVAWVSQRKDVLSTSFWMLTLLAYARYAQRPGLGRYLLVVLPFACGLLTKPMLVTLPVVLLVLDHWPLARRDRSTLALVVEKLPLLALSAAASAVTLWTQGGAGAVRPLGALPLADRIATALTNYALYLGKLAWPADLAVFYPLRPADASGAALGALVLAVVTGLTSVYARRAPHLLVGWLWYLVTLLPVVGLVQVGGQQIADRYAYLPSIGVSVMVAWGVVDLVRAATARRVLVALGGASLVAAAVLTHRQVGYWRDSITLFRRAVDVTRDNFLAENNLGEALAASGRQAEAEPHYAEAVRIHPGYAPARNNFGIVLASAGRYAEAEQHFRAALAANPQLSMAASNLATTRARLGDLPGALLEYRHALEVDPRNAVAYEGQADVLVLLGRSEEAVTSYREATRWALDPRPARTSLARTLRQLGRSDEAAREQALVVPSSAAR